MKQFKYIGNITKTELKKNNVHACINEEGYRCILIKNIVPKIVVSKYETDNLEVKLNAVLVFDEEEYYFHIITSKKNDCEANSGFELVYDYIFKKIQSPISDNELTCLILSLEEYFRITPEKDNMKLQIGVWGELFCVKKLYFAGFKEIVEKYHNNFFLKHDIEINEKVRIEVKTTINPKRIHHFSHDQIKRDDVEVYVVSIVLEEVQEGTSLLSLFNDIFKLLKNPDIIFELQKVMKMCGVSQNNQGIKFSETKAEQDMRYFDAKELPKIQGDIAQGISNIEYDVDCALSKFIPEEIFINQIRL